MALAIFDDMDEFVLKSVKFVAKVNYNCILSLACSETLIE